ncbi:glycosyltransferase 87 family protein [Kitasatospora sp. McL0602]|uniref:glycosyltransferase 87 family protein n=1 Tax=Kitasatospora sp. McL0602 TaxID=3439530 RepID=UPI003F8C8604
MRTARQQTDPTPSHLRAPRTRVPAAAWAVLCWLLSRAVLVAGALKIGPFATDDPLDYSVSHVYHGWFDVLASGRFPVGDVTWQYPPGAAGVILAPGLVPFVGYDRAFVLLCALCDAVVLAALVRAGRRAPEGGGRAAGPAAAWLWTLALPLLWTVPWTRFDIVVAALTATALLAGARRTPRGDGWFGVLVALGTLVKAWPVLLLIGTEQGPRTRRSWAAALSAGVLASGAAVLAAPGAFDFLTAQRERGVQFESLGALPFHLARHHGWSGRLAVHYGSTEFLGPYVGLVTVLSEVGTVLALGWLVWWRLTSDLRGGWVLPDAALTAVLLFTVTSRVLSPQYLVWLVALAAVCLVHPGTSQRPVAYLVLAACPLTMAVFPFMGRALVDGSPTAAGLLAARDLLLLGAALLSAHRLRRATRRPQPPVTTSPLARSEATSSGAAVATEPAS